MGFDTKEKIDEWVSGRQGCTAQELWESLSLRGTTDLRHFADSLRILTGLIGEIRREVLVEKLYTYLIKEGIVKCNF